MKEVLEHIKSRLDLFDNLYDYVRITDPQSKITYMLKEKEGSTVPLEIDASLLIETCYDFWGRSEPCENCVTIRAQRENKSFTKIDFTSNSIYFVQAVPVHYNGETYLMEMLKNVTGDRLLVMHNKKALELHNFIESTHAQLVTDELTGLYNRRFIEERLPADVYNAVLNNRPLTVAMVDIDYFKTVNDTYGHPAGDQVLKRIAQILRDNIDESLGWVARYGGEEFLYICKNTHKEQALNRSENLRKQIEEMVVHFGGNEIRVTCSFGLRYFQGSEGSMPKILEEADSLLYQAKNQGRNRTVINHN